MEADPFIKIIVVGEQAVGKTCLLNQYCYERFEANSPPTIGCDFTTKVTQANGQTVRLQLWDIAGQEKYNAVSKLYVRGALGCLIVCDIKDSNSLEETLKWKSIIEENSDQNNIPIMLVQNKCDLVSNDEKTTMYQNLQGFAKINKFFSCIQTSAKDGTGLKQLFTDLIQEIIDKGLLVNQQKNFKQSTNVQLNSAQSQQQQQHKKDKSCC
ncbi:unnamed protein product [Paramecium sonneborni]|uniref:Uncharacterized protein n=1 Tax=Paramecium sonneborni TaxID=65129 RepID=A0A8S1NIA0_9CILI|nr:unnamed protein product [Paramecium sonneborni]